MQHAVDEAPQTGQREEMLPLPKRHEIQALRAAKGRPDATCMRCRPFPA